VSSRRPIFTAIFDLAALVEGLVFPSAPDFGRAAATVFLNLLQRSRAEVVFFSRSLDQTLGLNDRPWRFPAAIS
jgi:hypothetical protein